MQNDRPRPSAAFTVAFVGTLVAGLLLLGFLGGCAPSAEPPPPVTVTHEARPVIAGECFAPDPAEPKLMGGNSLAALKALHAYKRALRNSRALRKACQRSLSAQS